MIMNSSLAVKAAEIFSKPATKLAGVLVLGNMWVFIDVSPGAAAAVSSYRKKLVLDNAFFVYD